MKSVEYDPAEFGRLPPEYAKAWLRRHGWFVLKVVQGRGMEIWGHPTKRGPELHLITDVTYADYADRVFDLCAAVGVAIDCSARSVLHEMLLSEWDTVRFRSLHPDSADGSIPLTDGEELHREAAAALVAAAQSTCAPRAVHSSGRTKPVAEYRRLLRLGQSAQGSYIVNILSPLRIPSDPDSVNQLPLLEDMQAPVPFGRRVTTTLFDALGAVSRAAGLATSEGSSDAFVEAVENGVSANLLEAVVGAACGGAAPVEVSVRWSTSLPPRGTVPTSVTFSPREIAVIGEVSRQFRKSFPEEGVELEGYIVQVNRETALLGDRVALATAIDGKMRWVSLALVGKAYQEAYAALGARALVRYRGNLIQKGRYFTLQDPVRVVGGSWPDGDDAALDDTALGAAAPDDPDDP